MVEQIFIIAFVTIGYCCVFWEDMIFAAIGDWMECNVPEWLWKPLGGCYICACMWIGSAVYAALYEWPHTRAGVIHWFFTCVGAMGVNACISQFVDKRHKVEVTSTPSTIEYEIKYDGEIGRPCYKIENEIVSNQNDSKDC